MPAVAGRSGGSHEAVVDGETGFVVDGRALDVRGARSAVLADDGSAGPHGRPRRARAVMEFSYETLAARLAPVVAGDLAGLGPVT